MTEQEKLLKTLFETPGVTHRFIHFERGPSKDATPEDMCREANKALEQVQ